MNQSKQYVKQIILLHRNFKQPRSNLGLYLDFMKAAKTFPASKIDRELSRKLAGRFKCHTGMCFSNSLSIARKLDGYQYYEGFATCMIPVEHAWIVSPEGKVIDPTWQRFFNDPNPPLDYYGVAIPWKEVVMSRAVSLYEPSWVRFLMKGVKNGKLESRRPPVRR